MQRQESRRGVAREDRHDEEGAIVYAKQTR